MIPEQDNDGRKKRVKHEAHDANESLMQVEPILPPTRSNPDDILIEMMQCGNYNQHQIVSFCRQSGIPLSRMLKLDLMRIPQR